LGSALKINNLVFNPPYHLLPLLPLLLLPLLLPLLLLFFF
jgi:hypothetical protein